MNTTILKRFGSSLILILAMGAIAFGQTDSDFDTITVSAKVLNPITVTGGDALDFGAVLVESETTIGAQDTEAGNFTVSATGGEQVTLSFDPPATLGNAEIIFKNGTHAWGTSTQAASTAVANLTDNTVTPDADAFSVWIGGTLEVTANAVAGDYSADFTLTVEYVD